MLRICQPTVEANNMNHAEEVLRTYLEREKALNETVLNEGDYNIRAQLKRIHEAKIKLLEDLIEEIVGE